MARKHGARQQKKIAKQKAKRQAKRSLLARRASRDPTVRLQQVEGWPVRAAYISKSFWDEGIGYVAVAREDPDGQIVFATFLVDLLCLGVKDAFWHSGTMETFRDLIKEFDERQAMRTNKPACLAKLVLGAVEFAGSFGFPPHHDYRHASHLLDGIDPADCREDYEFGEDGRPIYIQGPNETPAQAMAIAARVTEAGGRVALVVAGEGDFDDLENEFDDDDEPDDDDDEPDDEPSGGSRWRWPGFGSGKPR